MVQRLRLVSGFVLFAYIVTHFTNHAMGLLSLAAMERFLAVNAAFWDFPPVSALLYGAFAVHFALALRALYRRRTLVLPPATALQYAMGFTIPLLAIDHVVGTRIGDLYGGDFAHYRTVLTALWHFEPARGVLQLVLLTVAWIHACVGLRYRLRLEPWYERAQPLLFAAALLFPTLAALGYAEGGREILGLLARDPAFAERVAAAHAPAASAPALAVWLWGMRALFVGSVAAVFALRALRRWRLRRQGLVRISYPDGRSIDVVRGTSVLEASRLLRVPHVAVCGGKGRCSTCRIRVRAAAAALPAPEPLEAAVLRRIGADAGIRLACQLRPTGPIEATPLLRPAAAADGIRRPGYLQGSEKEIAILFADLRAFTRLAEKKLPFDVVFLLNRYFAAMGEAVEAAGGSVDKFLGDGVMALFGIETGAAAGCRAALEAARLMSLKLDDLNRLLDHELREPLRIGIGIHEGPVIVGEMGWGRTAALTAIGDAVNTASRLEGLSKEHGVELVVSEDVVRRAGADLDRFPRHEIELRGRAAPLVVRTVPRAQQIAEPAVTSPSGAPAVALPI